MMHCSQLCIKSGLLLLDKWLVRRGAKVGNYFGMLAKIPNLWRDHARLIFNAWALLFGSESATNNAKPLAPKCKTVGQKAKPFWRVSFRCRVLALVNHFKILRDSESVADMLHGIPDGTTFCYASL